MITSLWIAHAAFWAPFAVRALTTGRAPAAREAGRGILALHCLAFGILYAGMGLATQAAPPPCPPPAQFLAGIGLIAAATGLASWTLLVFRAWRVGAAPADEHTLCTSGPFGLVRHPIYAALGLLALGSALAMPSPWTIGGALASLVFGDVRARLEERLLRARHGEAYVHYTKRVRRFLPGVY